MASRLDSGASPSVVWIVGVIGKPDYCWFNFPNSQPGKDPAKVLFGYLDANEEYLDLFDAEGVQVWLQVEPGNADVRTLIDLVLARYASHPSVVGFGLDVEWYKNSEYPEGKAITDAEASAWVEQIRTYNPRYRLFLKHWLPEKMPPAYRDGVMFLDDSQQFRSLEDMTAEFVAWGQHFAPAPVGFQYGYPADRKWWARLADPPGDIGRALMSKVANTTDLYWVDFTAHDIWPPEE